ncbi:Calsyntenin-1 [Echinococcus granulosus]|nr:Calsyntenin-1 [Echinococcus granulosus]
MDLLGVTVLLSLFLYQGNVYVGQLMKHEASVKLSPKLRAFANPTSSRSKQICGFHLIVKDEYQFPFEVDLKNATLGTGEIRVRNDVPVDFTQNKMHTFQIEAYDCDTPPNYSERVLVNVNVHADEELRFTESVYNFSAVTYSSVGAICGKVTVTHETFTPPISLADYQCGYSLLAGDMVPFTVDSHGVIRSREVLTNASPRNFRFLVRYNDCGGAGVESATAVVNIKVIQSKCEPRWSGLPTSLYYSLGEQQPKRLLWPLTYHLDMCGMTCNEADSHIFTQVSLRHGLPGETLITASPSFCRHDPRNLHEQRQLCAIDTATLVDLLPDPQKDILIQHIAPAVGALPEVVPLSLGLLFSAVAHSGWRLDTSRLLDAASAASSGQEKVLPSTLFERDFTLSFWLQREPKQDDDHETILCSQEDTAIVNRALWISLKGSRVMVQMSAGNPQSSQPLMNKIFRTYFFPQLPLRQREDTADGQADQFSWHHYSISVTFDPETADISASTLMMDGELVGTLEAFGEPIYVTRQIKEFFPQFITVGTCYDPSIPAAQQSLNGALAGMTLLLGRNEDQSVSRCLAECGETLLIPRASRLITDDVNVLLNNDNIVIESVTIAEAAELISNIAYVKPRSTDTQLTFGPSGSNTRAIELATVFRCGERQLANISTTVIPLTLEDSPVDSPIYEAAVPGPLDSAWLPKSEMIVPPPVPVSSKRQSSSALVLAVLGQEVVRADIPVLEPGIVMFPGLEFTFTNVPSQMKSVVRSASMFILDQCLVLPVNGSGLNFNDGERIVWPAGRAFEIGVSVEPTQMGVLMKGHQTASQYASLLHGFRYWPPIEIEKRADDKTLAAGLLLERKFQLICSYNDAGLNTDPFTVQILLSSPIIAQEVQAGSNVIYSDNSRNNLDESGPAEEEYIDEDDDDEEDNYDDDYDMSADYPAGAGAAQWPSVARTYKILDPSPQYRSSMGGAQFAHSNKEVRPGDSLSLHQRGTSQKTKNPGVNNVGLAVGLGVGCLAIIAIVVAFFVSKSNSFRRGQLSSFRRGERKSVGHSQFRPETRLNIIENPIEKLEGGRLSWQPPVATPAPVLSEELPGVHAVYGARDEQFDAETRSFNGLFEEDEDDAGATEEEAAAAALEEVDDFDESEAVMSQHLDRAPGDVREVEGEEEGLSDPDDDEDTSFSVGPNHLNFVTLPGPRRGFNADV